MNKRQYRLVFNKFRGILMAVAENVASSGKSPQETIANGSPVLALPIDKMQGADQHSRFSIKCNASMIMVLLRAGIVKTTKASSLLAVSALVTLAHADIIADKTAPKNQQPIILKTANGLPLVTIQTPSSAGVSRNTYGQFDVNSNGAVLNNSASNIQTQLGGWIQGNPYLAKGTARIILNEVNSSNPSLLNGYVEVAGSNAQVVIANPMGISCNGCGFINANRVTLTTGAPVLNGGDLVGYNVASGVINVLGKGLDTRQSNYTDIIARAVNVNGIIWAQNLNIIAGVNQVKVDSSQIGTDEYLGTVVSADAHATSTNPTPHFSIDVAALGGMYAGKIHLVGTEAGVGVRNAGDIGASAGNVRIDVNGMLSNSGTITTTGSGNPLSLISKGIDNSGTISSQDNLVISSQGDARNSGLVTTDLELAINATGQMTNQGSLSGQRLAIGAAGLTNTNGVIQQTGSQGLSLTSQELQNSHNGLIGNTPVTYAPTTGAGGETGGTTSGSTNPVTPSSASTGATVSVASVAPVALANGFIAVGGNVVNDGGKITGNGSVDVNASSSLQNSGTFAIDHLNFTGTNFSNANGTINVGQTTINTNLFDNSHGQFVVANTLQLNAHDVNNTQGVLQQIGSSDLTLALLGNLDNTLGQIQTNATNLSLSANLLTNTNGQIFHAGVGSLAINATNLSAVGGQIATGGTLELSAQTATLDAGNTTAKQLNIDTAVLSNRSGTLLQTGTGAATIKATTSLDNTSGTVASNGNTTMTLGSLSNQGGVIQVANTSDLTLNATGALDNSMVNGVSGTIQSGGATAITAASVNNTQGQITAGNTLALTTSSNSVGVNNTQGRFAGNGGVVVTSAADINNTHARIESASGTIQLSAASALNNTNGVIIAQQNTSLNAASLTNTNGQISGADTNITTSGTLDNLGSALIAAQHDLSIHSGVLNNQNTLQATNNLTVTASGTISNSGTLYAQNSTAVTTQGDVVNSGLIAALGNTSLTATGATSHVSSTANGTLAAGLKTDGTLASSGDLSITATASVTVLGKQLSAGDQHITAQEIDLSGSLNAGQNLSYNAINGNVTMAHATVYTSGILSASTTQSLTTDGAQVTAGQLTIVAHDISNVVGSLTQTGSGDTTIQLAGNLNNDQGHIAVNSTNLTIAANTLTNTKTNGIQASITHAGTGALTLTATTLNGTGGLMQSNNAINLTANSATLDSGSTIAKQLNIDTAVLSNRSGTLLQTGTGAATIKATTSLDNTSGTVASNGNTTMTLGSLSNQGGVIQVANTSDLTLNATGALDNSMVNGVSGTIQSGGATAITAASVNNTQGQITAGNTLALTTSSNSVGVNNTQGLLAANQDLVINAANISNVNGSIGSAHGSTTLHASTGHIDNSSGTINAAQIVTIDSLGVNNTGGTLLANSLSLNSQMQTVDNTRGTIITASNANLQTGAFINDTGLLQTGGDLLVNTHGLSFSNLNSGTSKGILSQGAATILAGDVTNQTGYIGASGNINVQSNTLLNQNGVITSTAAVLLTSTSVNNQTGRIEALGNVDIETGSSVANTINNQTGLVRSGQTVTMTAGSVNNSNTQGANQGIQGGSVALTADQINNSTGAIFADNALSLIGSVSLNNTQGMISSSGSLTIADRLASVNSNVVSKTQTITNTGGTIVAGGNLIIDSSSLTGDGNVLSHGNLTTKLNRDYTNAGQWQANGNASLITTGNIVNQTTLQAGTGLTVQAANFDNTVSGQIIASNTELDVGATLTNRGLINGGNTFVNAAVINNIGTGRIYGDHIAIAAQTLTNDTETVNNATTSAVIAARNQLDIGASVISNREHALLFSAGDLAIGGALDANHFATGQAQTLTNASATIEALGNLSLNAAQITNSNEHFSTHVVTVSNGAMQQYQLDNSSDQKPQDIVTRFAPNQITLSSVEDGVSIMTVNATGESSDSHYAYQFNRTVTETQVVSSDPGQILSGGAMQITGGTVLNDKSKIIAGGTLTANIASLINPVVEGEITTTDVGTVIHYTRNHQKGNDNSNVSSAVYAPAASIQTINMGLDVIEQNTSVSGTGTQVASLTTGTVNQAAIGAGSANASLNNTTNQQNNTQVGSVHTADAAELNSATGSAANTQSGAVNNTNAATVNQASAVTSTSATSLNAITGTALNSQSGTINNATSSGPNQAGAVASNASTSPSTVVHTVAPNTTLPTNSLFHTNPKSTTTYLVATDPQFSNYRTWLSSDYMLSALGDDPATQIKRLGDGFYEQTLIRDQVAQLTGSRFLTGYNNDESEYQALMANGVTFAKKFNLALGVALSDVQIAQLTSDIVWLVAKTVTLPDGTTTTALVPQVYARLQPGDINNTGSLISADSMNLNVTGSINNGGTIAGRTAVAINANNINNIGGRISANNTLLNAQTDINNIGGTIAGHDSLIALAGHDINVTTTTNTQSNAQGSTTNINRIAGLYVDNPNGILVASAGNDVSLYGAQIVNAGAGGQTSLSAGHNLTLGTVATSVQNTVTWDSSNFLKQGSTTEVGTDIKTAGNIVLNAKQDLSLRAANVTSDTGNITAMAGNNLNIIAGIDTQNFTSASKIAEHGFMSSSTSTNSNAIASTNAVSSNLSGNSINVLAGYTTDANGKVISNGAGNLTVSGSNITGTKDVALSAAGNVAVNEVMQTSNSSMISNGSHHGFLSSSNSNDINTVSSNVAQGSAISGNQVSVTAGNDVTVRGSNIIGVSDVSLTATKGNVAIVSVQDSSQTSSSHQQSSSGLTASFTSGVASIGYGKANMSGQNSTQTVTQQGSSVASVNGNTRIQAGQDLSVVASDISAGQNLTLIGSSVDLSAAQNTSTQHGAQQSSSIGMSVGVTLNPIDAFKSAFNQSASSNPSTSLIGKATKYGDALGDGAMAASTPVVVQAGSKSASGSQNQSNSSAQISTLTAGTNLTILATGGSITSQGANMSAGGDALLIAKDNINLDVAHTLQSQDQSSTAKGWSLDNRGSLPVGSFNNNGKGNGTSDTITGTTLSAGGNATLATTSGDINLTAANLVATNDLTINAANNLTIQSGQNTLANANQSTTNAIGKVVISDTERFAGYTADKSKDNNAGVTQVSSNVGSLQGNVALTAGGDYTQTASNVLAKNDVAITGKSITINTAANTGNTDQSSSDLKVGAFATISSPLIDLGNNLANAKKSDGRVQALQGMAAAANGYQLASAASAAAGGAGSGELLKAEVGVGFSTAKSQNSSNYNQAVGSSIQGGGNVSLTSTQGDIHATDANIAAGTAAGNTLSLDSAKAIVLDASQSTSSANGSNHSSGLQVGVGYEVGAKTGAYIYATANEASGHNNDNATTNNNTQLSGNTVTLKSKTDTTLAGAVVNADTINANVGGKLAITSLQDTSTQDNKQSSVGARVQVAIGTAWDASGNASQSTANGSSNAVTQQSGLFAGNGGYHVTADTIDLKGGAIASSNAAKSALTTNALTVENISNSMSYSAQSVSMSGGFSGGNSSSGSNGANSTGNNGSPSTAAATDTAPTQTSSGASNPNLTPGMALQTKGSASSTTYGTLTDGNIKIGGQSMTSAASLGAHTDLATANAGIAALPNLKNVMTNQQAMAAAATTVIATGVQIGNDRAAAANQQAEQAGAAIKNANNTIAQAQAVLNDSNSTPAQQEQAQQALAQATQNLTTAQQAEQTAKATAASWGPTGDNTRALKVVTGLLVGGVSGEGISQLAANASAPYAAQAIGDYFTQPGHENQTAQLLTHAVLGGILAAANGTNAAAGASAGAAGELAAQVISKELYPQAYDANGNFHPEKLDTNQLNTVIGLSTAVGALVSGVAGGSAMDASVGANIAANAATNNFLKHDQATAMQKEFDQCSKKKGGCTDAEYVSIRNKYLSLSNQNIAQVQGCITNGDVACVKNLESQAAAGTEISNQLISTDQTIFINRQNNVLQNGSVKGAYSLFGTDVQQAQQIAEFKQANCVNLSASDCSGLVNQALNDRMTRVGVLGLVSASASLMGSGLTKLKLPSPRSTGVPISEVAAAANTTADVAGADSATNTVNGVKLNNQLTSQAITDGHAFDKHIGEFSDLGITTDTQLQQHVENVINNATNTGSLSNGRSYYYDANSNTIVIKNPNAADAGTTFRIDTTRYPNPLDYIKTLR